MFILSSLAYLAISRPFVIVTIKKDVGLEKSLEKSNDTRYNVLSAALVFFISFGVYLATAAPSIAFWDCGEYTAVAHSLGIAHPPGNPLFILMMRVVSMFLPFFEDVGYRMNFAVALSSALTAMFIYLIIIESAKLIIGRPDTAQKRIATYTGAIVGGLFAAFGYTFWFSAVETSVYNICMLNIVICTWLVLRWAQSKAADRDKLLVLVAFLGFLGIGLHMYSMVIFPPAFLFIILWDEKKRKDWRLWLTGILMASILLSLATFLWFAAIALSLTFIMSMTAKKSQYQWRFCFMLALFAVIGYSVHLFIPIRSALEPMINQNHPSTWEAFVGFIERRQYGSESMVSRMFWRRGYWSSQLGIEEHMGYGGFHITQFFRLGPQATSTPIFGAGFIPGMSKLIIYLVPTVLMLYAWFYMWKRNRSAAVFLISLTLVTTIGLVLYMNFADGNRPERFDFEQWERAGRPGPMPTVHREVRVRDYFFTAGFMYFGMWIGMAATCILHALFSAKDAAVRKTAAPICAILLLVSPVIPAVTNYNLSNRSGDWVPYDYAYNLLMSCEPNGIIFTNGDNDTFPLWALQEAYGIRRDVRVVNLSLANTDWYIKQLKKLEPQVPISYTETEIETQLQPQRNPFPEPRQHTLRNAGITLTLPGARDHRVLRVQDMMVLNIVDATNWTKPIYFAMTVSDDNMMGLAPYLQNRGLVYRVMPERVTAETHYNLERALELIDGVYKFRGIGKARTNDTSRRLLTNYLQLAFDLRRPMERLKREITIMRIALADSEEGSEEALRLARLEAQYDEHKEKVIRFLDRCAELIPWDWRARAIRHEFLMDNDMVQEALNAMESALKDDPANSNHYETMLEQAKRSLEMQALRQGTGEAESER
ncbi:MAG: DUF2723 domain-containing protein [Chitinispirillia bacterium]|nr:DUF2723 domain-containing protein [Chitinispirillia bacterium]